MIPLLTNALVGSLLVRAQIVAAVLALGVLLLVIRLVRRSVLRDAYALLWVIIGIGATVVAVFPAKWWDRIASAIGISSGGTTLLLVLGLFGVLVLILQLSITVTRLERLTTGAIIQRSVEDVRPSDGCDGTEAR